MTSDDAMAPKEAATPPAPQEPASPAETTDGKPAEAKPAKPTKPVKPGEQQQTGVVPKKAAEDDPRTWGDSDSDNDHDAWLREQKPPHWG